MAALEAIELRAISQLAISHPYTTDTTGNDITYYIKITNIPWGGSASRISFPGSCLGTR
ncbi:hypothetical protein [Microseira wollei]|uniref:hypothetical protein n=1 Tax=Microseira wollei TaxID=467598 RepID=UPI001CFF4BFE|nr:hypothetical protein [Microseira wollei]